MTAEERVEALLVQGSDIMITGPLAVELLAEAVERPERLNRRMERFIRGVPGAVRLRLSGDMTMEELVREVAREGEAQKRKGWIDLG